VKDRGKEGGVLGHVLAWAKSMLDLVCWYVWGLALPASAILTRIGEAWRWWWHIYMPWMPMQPCLGCKCWYWGGWPRPGWVASYQTYCSKDCHDRWEW
jgi:hypothetical protein